MTLSIVQNWQTLKESVKFFTQSAYQFEQSLKETTSGAIETGITAYIADLVTQHPIFLRILQIFGWAVNHPIISLVVLLFVIAIAGSIFKGIIHLIETVSWSILKVPYQLIQALFKASFISLTKFGNRNLQKITSTQNSEYISEIIPVNTRIYQDKQQRLAEIHHRLEIIHKEQQQLLQEAAYLIGSEDV
jgi:hypothetical protein